MCGSRIMWCTEVRKYFRKYKSSKVRTKVLPYFVLSYESTNFCIYDIYLRTELLSKYFVHSSYLLQ